MEQQLKLGDVVRLKSGGPLMVVSFDYEDSSVAVSWFTSLFSLESKRFRSEMLSLIEKAPDESLHLVLGSVVKLRSGGPALTIHALNEERSVVIECSYFVGDSLIEERSIKASLLRLIQPGELHQPQQAAPSSEMVNTLEMLKLVRKQTSNLESLCNTSSSLLKEINKANQKLSSS